ncbi:MAG: alpha/beta hydrolase [Eubacteriales bacterium]|nr:alpha/beta hydrolase [Eubacteriales bacterium]
MPNETKKDFCCLIISGFGAGYQAGIVLRDHMYNSGMDTFLTTPSGKETLRIDTDHWIHSVRMEYLALRKQYQRVAVIGLSLGGMLQLHLLDLKPAAMIFVNAPAASVHSARVWNRVFQADLQARLSGLRAVAGKHQLRRLVEKTRDCSVYSAQCPALVLQTMDDTVCDPSHADKLFKLLHMPDKNIRFYPEGGHDVLTSQTVLAVCSDIFQFCSRVRGLESVGGFGMQPEVDEETADLTE